jgi:hypothetical protein
MPAAIHAQFKQPTAEELKMTDDPKAPGAAAVYLNIEESTNDEVHFRSYYARIKVLTEKGKELATIDIPYYRTDSKITSIQGRTIHSDGTVILLIVKPEDLLIAKSGENEIKHRVFTLPSVEVGSILEYRYDLNYDDNIYSSPTWDVQRNFFVHHAHYFFTPYKGFLRGLDNMTSNLLEDQHGNPINALLAWPILPPGVNIKTDAVGHKSLDVTDVPAAPDEEWMPPIESILYKVHFYYLNANGAMRFWVQESKQWSSEVNHFAEPSKSIRDAVSGLVAPDDSNLEKAAKLYKAVQALDNTDYSRKKGHAELKHLKLKEAKRAEDTWAQKSGSSEDIALLYLAMARAAGVTAYAMKVVDRSRAVFDPAYLNMNQLDDTIIILSIDATDPKAGASGANSKNILVDPGEKMCPFERLKWTHSDTRGIRQAATGDDISITPIEDYNTNTLLRAGNITIDAHGAVTGVVKFIMTGQEALRWRQIALRNDEDEVKKQFEHELESIVPDGVEAHIDHFVALDDPDSNLVAQINLNGSMGTATSRRLMLPGFFFETRGHQPFVGQEKRLEPVDMRYGEKVTDQIVYHLPDGLTVEGAPQAANNSWPGHAVYAVKTIQGSGQITIVRSLTRAFTQAKPEEYQDLRGFYQKVDAADQQQLILTASPAAKGN